MSVNSWIDGKVLALLQACGVELPGGDGATLRSIASGWDGMGEYLTSMTSAISRNIADTDQHDWSGPARMAFEQHWQSQASSIDDMANNFHKIADGLRSYAQEIDSINESIIDICVQIAEMEVGGAILSIFTAGIADLVANTAVMAKVAKVIDLVKLFTTAAEKVAKLLEDFFELSEETAATLAKVLGTVAKFSANFMKTGLESFVTNFAADTGSQIANQALTGQKIKWGSDASSGAWDAAGSAVFTAGGAGIAESAGMTGRIGQMLSGDGLLGTTVNGAVGNIVGGVTMDVANGSNFNTIAADAATNAATGALGNAANDRAFNAMEDHGSLGGENLSDRGKLADAALKNGFSTGLNTAIYTGGSGIESDIQSLEGQDPKLSTGGNQQW